MKIFPQWYNTSGSSTIFLTKRVDILSTSIPFSYSQTWIQLVELNITRTLKSIWLRNQTRHNPFVVIILGLDPWLVGYGLTFNFGSSTGSSTIFSIFFKQFQLFHFDLFINFLQNLFSSFSPILNLDFIIFFGTTWHCNSSSFESRIGLHFSNNTNFPHFHRNLSERRDGCDDDWKQV